MSGIIFGLCIVLCLMLVTVWTLYAVHRSNTTFNVNRGNVGYLTDNNNKILVNNNIFYYRNKPYKKKSNENKHEIPIEGASSFLTNCITNDDKPLELRIKYRYTLDLTHFFDTLKNSSYYPDAVFTALERYISDIVQYSMLQINRKDLYNYKTFDKMYQDINDALPEYLLKRGIYMDIKIINIKTY